jgi:hypothetical protein
VIASGLHDGCQSARNSCWCCHPRRFSFPPWTSQFDLASKQRLKVKFCKARRSNAPSHRTEAFRRGTIASVVVAIRKHTFYFQYPPERDASAQICFFLFQTPPPPLPLNSSLNTAARTRTRSSLGVMLSPAAAAPLLDIIYIPHSVRKQGELSRGPPPSPDLASTRTNLNNKNKILESSIKKPLT